MKRVLIAMSGGVDSSVAAWLLKNDGYDCTGAMMKLYTNDDAGLPRENGCCTLADAEDARTVAFRLGIPFYLFNFTKQFSEQVIRRFVNAYQNGHTPNPCIDCNQWMKFGCFLKRACEIGCHAVATGHYARIERDNGRYLLKKGADESKDQSYVLFGLTQSALSKVLFPLGGITKARVREIAAAQGFFNADKQDSQDICFIPNGDYAGFIERYAEQKAVPGDFVDREGRVLGRHRGIIHYTVGQRKGLGLAASEPWYVLALHPDDNTVVLGQARDVYGKTLTAHSINLIAADKIDGGLRVGARIRYRHAEQPATVWQTGPDTLHLEFDSPQRAITKGQAAVLYDGDVVVGGGIIG